MRRALAVLGLLALVAGTITLAVFHDRVTRQAAGELVAARNVGRSFQDPPDEVTRTLRVPVGDGVELDVWYTRAWGEPPPDPVDLMVILHGVSDNKRTMWPLARRYAVHGVDSILVDLRGHGRSTEAPLTYGVKESQELVRVLDHLAAEGFELDDVGVYGPSYGGAVALQFGCRDPRVRRVVSVGGFGTMRALMEPHLRSKHELLPWVVPSEWVEGAVNRAGVIAGFDPDEASARDCVGEAPSAEFLLVHSPDDEVVPFDDVVAVADACGSRCRILELPGKTHHESLSNQPLREALHEFTAGEPLPFP